MHSMAVTLLYGLYCLEAGVFFIIAPWTRFWAAIPLLHVTPALGFVADSPYFRGFVSGIGLIHLIIGVKEFVTLFIRRVMSRNG